jgi:hypothetical protein
VLGWNVPLQRKLVEKSCLIDLPFAYHALHPRPRCLSESALRTVHKPEFFNTIRTRADLGYTRRIGVSWSLGRRL